MDGVDVAVVTGLVVGGEAISEGGRTFVNIYSTTLSKNKPQ